MAGFILTGKNEPLSQHQEGRRPGIYRFHSSQRYPTFENYRRKETPKDVIQKVLPWADKATRALETAFVHTTRVHKAPPVHTTPFARPCPRRPAPPSPH